VQYEEAVAHLDGLINHEAVPRAGAVAGLSTDPMVAIMAMLGDPHRSYPVIHVTGTNGKGSSVRMMEALFEGMGLRTGAYLSPHLESTTERIRTGGETISEDAFGEVIGDVVLALEAHSVAATWFETVTAAALLHFANEAVDVAVIEVGLLGRYDATNVVEAQVACVTNIGLDHSAGEATGGHRSPVRRPGSSSRGARWCWGRKIRDSCRFFSARGRRGPWCAVTTSA